MSEGWKQVWEDIRQTLGAPKTEERPEEQESGKAAPLEDFAEPKTAVEQERAVEEIQPDISTPESEAEEEWIDESVELNEDPNTLTESAPEKQNWLPTALLIGGVVVAIFSGTQPLAARPPAENVIATYDGGQITVEDVQQHLALLAPRKDSCANNSKVWRAIVSLINGAHR